MVPCLCSVGSHAQITITTRTTHMWPIQCWRAVDAGEGALDVRGVVAAELHPQDVTACLLAGHRETQRLELGHRVPGFGRARREPIPLSCPAARRYGSLLQADYRLSVGLTEAVADAAETRRGERDGCRVTSSASTFPSVGGRVLYRVLVSGRRSSLDSIFVCPIG